MSSEILECISPYIADIGIIASVICVVGMLFGLFKNALFKGELKF